MKYLLIIPIYLYQILISPYLGHCCRFYPSCSEYSKQAIYKHGFFKGFYLMIKRLLKCHPYHNGGHDPVPPLKNRTQKGELNHDLDSDQSDRYS